MKLLLDENLPHDLRHQIPNHDVFTVTYMGWNGTKNGDLLRLAAAEGFDALITMDVGISYQQSAAPLAAALIVIEAVSNDIHDLLPIVPKLLAALDQFVPNSVVRVN